MKLIFTIVLMLAASSVSAKEQPKKEGSKKLIVELKIDSPARRLLVLAIPEFQGGGADAFRHIARVKLQQLLQISSYFKILSFSKVNTDIGKQVSNKKFPEIKTDLQSWRKLGSEAIVTGQINKIKQKFQLKLQGLDLIKMQRITSKVAEFKDKNELEQILRKFVDQFLLAYTGKPGIYSSRIYFVGKRSPKAFKHIYSCLADGSDLQQHTSYNAIHMSPFPSPDGKYLLYTLLKGRAQIYILDLQKKKTIKATPFKGISNGGVFAPRGPLMVFSSSTNGNTELYSKLPNSRTRNLLLKGPGIDVEANFSPNGKWLSFVSGRFGQPHIFVGKVKWSNNHTKVQVTEDRRLTYAGWYNATPAFSPDSQKIAFGGFDRDIGHFDLFVIGVDGKNTYRLTLNTGNNVHPSWAPGGQMLVFQSDRHPKYRRGPRQLYLMSADGSQQRLLKTLYSAESPRWGPHVY